MRVGSALLVVAMFSRLAPVAIGAPDPDGGTTGDPPRYPTGSIVPSSAPIELPGHGGVSDAGGATYSLPLLVPDGPQGAQPRLSIEYGGRGNGSLGVGFHLAGSSAIAPCSKTRASEGYADNVEFGIDDSYCLDGQKLVLHGEPGFDVALSDHATQYHTEVESFEHVVAHRADASAAQPDTFTVHGRDGSVRTYEPVFGHPLVGANDEPLEATDSTSKLKASNQSVAVIYVLTGTVDKNGNRVDYVYDHADAADATETAFRLTRIDYSYAGGWVPLRSVRLNYQTRDDQIVRYVRGVKMVSRSRLESIETYAPNPTSVQKVWTYKLAYLDSADTGRSLLSSVQLCDQFDACSWIRSFTYTHRGHANPNLRVVDDVEFDATAMSYDGEQINAYWNDYGLNWLAPTDVRVILYDIDGDGDDDAIYRTRRSWVTAAFLSESGDMDASWLRHVGSVRIRISSQDHPLDQAMYDVSSLLEPSFDDPSVEIGEELAYANLGKSRIADFDGDGRLDLMLARTRLIATGISVDPLDERYTLRDRWEYGFRTFRGRAFDLTSELPYAAGDAGLDTTLIHGPILRYDGWGGSFPLAKPPFQRVVADLDGDARPEIIDAVDGDLDSRDPPGIDWNDPYSYVDAGTFDYHATLSTDGYFATFDQPWTCGNGRALVADLDGDGRDEVMVTADALSQQPGTDPITGTPTYRRLALSDPWSSTTPHGVPDVGETSTLWGGYCTGDVPDLVMGDWNGDGLVDALYPPGSYGNNADPLIRWNLGPGFGPAIPVSVTGAAGIAALMKQDIPKGKLGLQIAWDRGTRVADVDGDGRSDIVAFRQDNKECIDPVLNSQIFPPTWGCENKLVVFRSRGDSFEGEEIYTWSKGGASFAEGFTTDQIGDVDGDGALDAVFVNAGKLSVITLPWGDPPDLLESVRDTGAAYPLESFEYTRAWWGDQPRAEATAASPITGNGACKWPIACPTAGFTVVRHHEQFRGTRSDGSAMWSNRYHKYSQPRTSMIGRGSLGFHTHETWDRELGKGTVRVFDNTLEVDPSAAPGGIFYPHAYPAEPSLVVDVTPLRPVPTDAELASTEIAPGLVANQTTEVRTRWSTSDTTLRSDPTGRILTVLPTSSRVSDVENTAVPWTTTSTPSWTATSWVGNGPTTTTTTTFDAYANPLVQTVEIGTGTGPPLVTRVHSSTYDNRFATWQLGLPLRSVQQAYDADDDVHPSRVVRRTYDTRGNVASLELDALTGRPPLCPLGTDPHECEVQSTVTAIDHDSYGNIAGTKTLAYDDALPRETSVTWDPEGVYPVTTTDALGFTRTRLFHPALGVPIVDTDVDSVTTMSTYDGFARPRSATRQGMPAWTRSYMQFASGVRRGLRVDDQSDDGSQQYFVTDELGRPVDHAHRGFGGAWRYTHDVYDAVGNQIRAARPELVPTATAWTESTYDRLGQLLARTTPDGATTVLTPSILVTTAIDPMQHETFVRRDLAGRVAQTGHRVDGADYGDVTFDYGPFDLVAREIDAFGNKTAHDYDSFGHVIREDDPDRGVTTGKYNGFGELVRQERANGDVFEHQYDSLGRPTMTLGPDGKTKRTYDVGAGAAGKLTQVDSADGVTTAMHYDTLGRVHAVDQTVDGVTRSMIRRYDALGRLEYLFYPEVAGTDRFTVEMTYGFDGDLRTLRDASACHLSTTQGAADPSCASSLLWQVTGRDLRDSITTASFGNGTVATRTYDPNTGRLERLSAAGSVTDYVYDEDGQLIARSEPTTGRTEAFTYDDLHRLAQWTFIGPKGGHSESPVGTEYRYDELGNLEYVSVDGATTFEGTFGTAGEPPHELGWSSVGGAYGYDASGRQIAGDGRTIAWSEYDLPHTIVTPSSTRMFRYDGAGKRVSREDAASSITYVGRFYEHRESASTGTRDVFMVYGDPGLVAQVDYSSAGKTTRYVVSDPIDNASLVLASSGAVEEHAYFDPFGGRVNSDGVPTKDPVPSTSFGFTGHETDGDDLVNMQGRIYDRRQYRFLSPDPIVGDRFFGQAYNPYSYVYNNPLVNRDPTGFQVHDASEFDDNEYDHHQIVSESSTLDVWAPRRTVCGGDGGCSDPDSGSSGIDAIGADGDASSHGDSAAETATDRTAEAISRSYQIADDNRRASGAGGAPTFYEHVEAYEQDAYGGTPTLSQRDEVRNLWNGGWTGQFFTYTPPEEGPRTIDFVAGSVSFGPFSVSVDVDRYGNFYLSGTPLSLTGAASEAASGKAGWGVSLYAGRLAQANPPTEKELQRFMTGESLTVEGGYWGAGAGVTFANGEDTNWAWQLGLRSPGISAGLSYGVLLDEKFFTDACENVPSEVPVAAN
jgi:RHS repeat-associated protein